MKRWGLWVALLLASSSATAGLVEREKDIYDRPVAPLLARGLPTLVLYANKATKDAVQGPATELAVDLHDVPFITLVHVDLRDIPSLFRGIARSKIRSSHHDGVARFNRAFEDRGYTPPTDAAERLVFVADNDGAAHESLGLNRGFTEALAVIFDSDGQEVFRGAFPRDKERVEQALREASQRRRTASH